MRFRQENYDPEEKERRHEIEALRAENKRLKEVSASNLEASMESFKLVCERDRKMGEKLRAAHFIHLTQEPGQVIYRYEDYRDLIMEMVRSKATYDGEYDAVSAGKPSTPIPVFENALRKSRG